MSALCPYMVDEPLCYIWMSYLKYAV